MYFCIRVASGPRVNLASCKSALNPLVVKRLPVHHHSADYITFGIIGPIMVYLKMKFCSCIR